MNGRTFSRKPRKRGKSHYLLACQVIVTAGDSGLCCCVTCALTAVERCKFPLPVDFASIVLCCVLLHCTVRRVDQVDDDTFVVMENLRYYLSHLDPGEPFITGRHFRHHVTQARETCTWFAFWS